MPNILHRAGIGAEPMRVVEALAFRGVAMSLGGPPVADAFDGGRRLSALPQPPGVLHADASLVKWRYSGPAEDWVGTEFVFHMEWRDRQTFELFRHGGWREPNKFMHHCSTKWATFLLIDKGVSFRNDASTRRQSSVRGTLAAYGLPLHARPQLDGKIAIQTHAICLSVTESLRSGVVMAREIFGNHAAVFVPPGLVWPALSQGQAE